MLCILLIQANQFLVLYIQLLYYYINLRSSITFCLFSGDIYIYFSLSISLLCSIFEAVSKLLSEVFNISVINQQFCCQSNNQLLLLFFELLFQCSFKWICWRFISMIQKILAYLRLSFLRTFLPIILAKTKIHNLL